MRRVALGFYRRAARALLPRAFRDEFAHELEQTVEARLASARGPFGLVRAIAGETVDLARTAARERLGMRRRNVDRRTGGGAMGGGWSDVATSLRSLTKRPALALAVTLTIGLGIGATTTIYSVVDGVVLRPLPYEEPERLVALGALAGSPSPDPETGLQELVPMLSQVYTPWRERARSIDRFAAISPGREMLTGEDGTEENVVTARVSPELFDLFGVAPALGRTFLAEEYALTTEWIVMISYEFWQSRFGGDPDVLNAGPPSVQNALGRPPRIVGVLPEGFRPPETFFASGEIPQIYAPLPLADAGSVTTTGAGGTVQQRVAIFSLMGVGRLAPGATVEQARAEAEELYRAIEVEVASLPVGPAGARRGIGVNGLHAQTVGTAGGTLWIFLGAAGLLLALAAMNAATLVLARALDRSQELAVRVALGAGRTSVVRLLLAESGILAAAGGALGVALAFAGVAAFLRYAPDTIPRLATVVVDARVLAAAAIMTLGTAVVAGLLPALRLTARAPWQRLQSGGRSVAEPGTRLRSALVGGQLALAVVLLAGAGLLFGSFVRLRSTPPGFEAEGLILATPTPRGPMRIAIGPGQSPRDIQIDRVWSPALATLASVPGVQSVAVANALPFQAPSWVPRLLLPGDGPDVVREAIAGYVVTPGYFETMGSRVLAGRGLEGTDVAGSEPVVVVNEAFVRTQLGEREPLGALVRRTAEQAPLIGAAGIEPGGSEVVMRIVGVVEDAVQARPEDGARPAIYLPYGQADFPQLARIWAVARTRLPAATVLPEVRRAIAEAGLVAQELGTMQGRMVESRATPRFQTFMISAFAAVALLLAAAGLHGSLAHAVRRRQRELGVRMALGADRASVLGLVMRQGLRLTLAGLALGMLAALAFSRFLAAFLYDMQPYDPPTLLAVAALLLVVAVVACLAPARRATKVDPVRVLQAE
jgi:predicted permease